MLVFWATPLLTILECSFLLQAVALCLSSNQTIHPQIREDRKHLVEAVERTIRQFREGWVGENHHRKCKSPYCKSVSQYSILWWFAFFDVYIILLFAHRCRNVICGFASAACQQGFELCIGRQLLLSNFLGPSFAGVDWMALLPLVELTCQRTIHWVDWLRTIRLLVGTQKHDVFVVMCENSQLLWKSVSRN